MPSIVTSKVDNHDQAIIEALDKFCNFSKQTYDQFLSSFTSVTPENVRSPYLTAAGVHRTPSFREMDSSREGHRKEEGKRNVTLRVGQANCSSPTADQEEFDNYLGDCDGENAAGIEEEEDITGTHTLPGEIEEDLIAVSPSPLCHHTLLEISTTFTDQRTHSCNISENQNKSDEVVPFHLDEDFDYNNVVLSHKHGIQEQNNRSS